MLTNEAYSSIKKLVLLWLPGIATISFILSYFWEIPDSRFVINLCVTLAFFFGICLTISEKRYKNSKYAYDGQLVYSVPEEGKKRFSLEVSGDPSELDQKESVTFKVVSAESLVDS